MSDMTSEPTGTGPDDVTPVEPNVAATEPIPVAEYAAPAPEAEPVYAAVPPAAPVGAPAVAAPSDHVSISKKWLLMGGGAIVAVILLGGTFAAGASVGRHGGGRFDGRGAMMGQFQGGSGMQAPGGQGQFRGDGDNGGYHQRGGRDGRGGDQGLQRQGVPQGQLPGVPNTQQNPSTAPTQ